ncbi:MAG: hypothetical protein FJ225_02200 [Lentisphaerae bacterium]|nr:hypothetical protein [Lentisphaerota bacterium]
MENLFWVLIVLATIVAQIVKLSRRRGPAPAAPREERDPDETLRRLLEEITGVAQPRSRPPAPPQPRPAPAIAGPSALSSGREFAAPAGGGAERRQGAAGRPAAPAARARKPRPPAPPALPGVVVPLPAAAPLAADAYAQQGGRPSAAAAKLRPEILADVAEAGALRRAVLLREILGPPRGMRPAAR